MTTPTFRRAVKMSSAAAVRVGAGTTRLVAKKTGDVWFKNESKWQKWLREFRWKLWDGKRYGLHWHDQFFYVHPTVREAVRRLGIKEPWEYDARNQRIMKASLMSMRNEVLPKEKWTKFEDESWYLHEYIQEIEEEMTARTWGNARTPKHVDVDNTVKQGGYVNEPQP